MGRVKRDPSYAEKMYRRTVFISHPQVACIRNSFLIHWLRRFRSVGTDLGIPPSRCYNSLEMYLFR